ncbi:MAG TPA: prolipoprotein diacylglyceryl transferase family protein [Kofleriaceae bacterium]|nr:prolipoprotein diacylglyceryl transferase family protein [Kofleriaceae bacterium]
MRPALIAWLEPHLGYTWARILAPNWFTFVSLAAIVAGVLLLRNARARGADSDLAMRALVAAYVAAVIAGIVGPMLYDMGSRWAAGRPVGLRWAGMTSWAGFAGALVAVAFVLRRAGTMSLARFGDLAAMPLAGALVVARFGCVVAGCDYGKVTALPWAMRFPGGSPAWRDHVHSGLVPASRDASLPVHPTQLYESLLGVLLVVLAVLLARTAWARARDGRLFGVVALAYVIGRWPIENLRGDAGRGFFAALSTGQLIGAAVAIACAAMLWRMRDAGPRLAAAVALLGCLSVGGMARAQPSEPVAQPPPQPAEQPADPYAAPGATEAPASPYPEPEILPAAPLPASTGASYEIALMLGTAASLNRRDEQIPALGGISLSGTLDLRGGAGIGLDLDSLSSSVATHGSILLAASMRRGFGKLALGGRGGIGLTQINFRDPAFRDVITTGLRAGATLELELAERWVLEVWPMTFDWIGSAAVGGPIITYQFRVGIAYRNRRPSHQPPPAP